jgi:thiol-disulfide isomerase/thioredoxin
MIGFDSKYLSGLQYKRQLPIGYSPVRIATLLILVAGILVNEPGLAGKLLSLPDAIPTSELALPDVDGAEYRLSDLRGSVVLVNFWASWCQPCVKEIPNLQRLRASYAGKPFEILAINVMEDENQVRHFVTLHGINFPVLLDRDGKQFAAWGSEVLPTTFVIDATGIVRYVGIADLEWDTGEALMAIDNLVEKAR